MNDPKTLAGLYRVRLTVDGMKHSIEQCLLDHDGTLRASVEAEVKAVVAAFDFQAEVRRLASDVLKQVMQEAFRSAFYDAREEPEVKALFRDAIRKALLESMS